jgi:hypothetical protein
MPIRPYTTLLPALSFDVDGGFVAGITTGRLSTSPALLFDVDGGSGAG